jgi:hypothetical protein
MTHRCFHSRGEHAACTAVSCERRSAPPLSPPPRPPLPPPSAASRMDESLPTTLQLTKRRRSFKISASAATSSV